MSTGQSPFYREAFGFEVVEELPGRAAFLRAAGSENHHDLGLFALGADAPGPQAARRAVPPGLGGQPASRSSPRPPTRSSAWTRSWKRPTTASKSLYGQDPDGNEFEVMWATPRDEWGDGVPQAPLPLDLERELARFGTDA